MKSRSSWLKHLTTLASITLLVASSVAMAGGPAPDTGSDDEAAQGTSSSATKASKKSAKQDENCSSLTDQTATKACTSAKSACTAITPQESMLIQQALNQMKNSLTQSASTSAVTQDKSAATSCKIGAGMAAIAGTATLALAVSCETKASSCKSKNNTAAGVAGVSETDKANAQANVSYCSGLTANWVGDGLQALTYYASAAQNYECAKYYEQAAADAATKTCAEEPTRADCVCVINPNDPSCLGQTAGLTASGGFTDSTLRGNGASADSPLDSVGADAVAGSPGSQAAGGAPAAAGSGPGGPSLLGGKSSPDGQDGQSNGDYNTNILGGTTSGSGGNPYARGGGGEGSEHSSLLDALKAKLNLKKYLPGNRGLASVGRDGLTGANGPSIWEKVSTQYNRKKGEMVP